LGYWDSELIPFWLFAEPLLVRAAKRENVERAPAWMMRQAGRYMAAYRKLAEKHPSFRERSENVDLIVEISLQPWKAFRPDGVIIFSDILTPLPAIGIPFEIDEAKGPVLESPIESDAGLQALHSLDFDKVKFVGESLSILRKEVCSIVSSFPFGSSWLKFPLNFVLICEGLVTISLRLRYLIETAT